jgi:hypothetical protein
MPATVPLLVVADGALSVSSSGNDGTGALLAQGLAQAVGVVAFVAKQVAHAARAFEQCWCSLHVAERAAHAIGLPATTFGRYQSITTLLSALGNLARMAVVARLPRLASMAFALGACGIACALLTTVTAPGLFATALVLYNVSWFITYPLLLGLA